METVIQQLIESITQQAGLGGWAAVVGGIGVVVTFTIRVFQVRWPKRWGRLHPLAKIALPFAAATVGTFVLGIAGALAAEIALGPIVGKLIAAAVGAGIASIGAAEGSKTVGVTWDMAALKRDPDYDPGKFRKMSSLVIAVPNIEKAKKLLSGD